MAARLTSVARTGRICPMLGLLKRQIFPCLDHTATINTHTLVLSYYSQYQNNRRHLFTLKKSLQFKPEYKKDGVPETYQLVYENSQGRLLATSRVLSSAAGTFGVGLTFWYLASSWSELPDWQMYTVAGVGMCSLAAVVSVNIIARFYLDRIYFHEQEGSFIGIYKSLYGQTRQFKYSVDDIATIPQGKTKLSLSKTTVKIRDNSFHIRAADFILPKFYNAHLKFV